MKEKNLDFLINNLILFGKHFIHGCKYLKVKQRINVWKNELTSVHDRQKRPETIFFIGLLNAAWIRPSLLVNLFEFLVLFCFCE